jgi:TrmH family RNA methyltransferase
MKKNRDKESVFIAEGVKLVGDLLPYFKLKTIVATQDWLQQNRVVAEEIIDIEDISEMKKISQLTTPSPVFALFYRQNLDFDIDGMIMAKQLVLALDSIQDPGNMVQLLGLLIGLGLEI